MPNLCVSANAAHLPSLTRRGLLTGTAVAAISTMAGPAQAGDCASDPKIDALSQRFTDALAACATAERHRNACEDLFLSECPDPPLALTHAGRLGRLKREWDHWRADGLAMLLADRGLRQHWRAARKLLPLARAYEKKVRAFERAIGLPAAEAAQEAASDALHDVSAAILGVPANSAAALVLKARVVRWDKPDWWDPVEGRADIGERVAAQVLDAVAAMATGRACPPSPPSG